VKSRIARLVRLARKAPELVIIKYVSPENPDPPEPPEEVKRAALEEARREGKPVAVVYWPPARQEEEA